MSMSQPEVSTSTAIIDSRAIRRAVAGVSLVGIALIHALDLEGKLAELPYVGFMFIALILASLVVAEGLIRSDSARVWLAACALAGGTMSAYIVSRTLGMPGDGGEDVGNWLEPLGLASLVVEGIVVLLALGRLTDRR